MSGTDIELPQTMDANAAPVDAPAERQLSPREVTMAAIAARAEEARQREMDLGAIYDQDARDAGLAMPGEDDTVVAPVQAVTPTAPSAPIPAASAPIAAPAPVRTIVVDGHQYAVTDDQADQLMRLGMLANTALHSYQQQAPAHQAPVHAAPPQPIVDPEAVKQTIEKIQYGAPDDAVAALTNLITGVVARVPVQQVDPNDIVQRAVIESRHQSQLAADSEAIRRDYPEIFADPQRQMLANINVAAIRDRDMRLGRQRSELEIYREAGDAVYDALGKPRPGSEQNPPSALQAASGNVVPIRQDVVERKRAAPRATQAIDLRAPAPAAPRAPTGSDIVDRMRQARGQASMR